MGYRKWLKVPGYGLRNTIYKHMKKILTLFLLLIALSIKSQNVLHAGVDWRIDDSIQSSELKSMSPLAACGSPFLSTGYPVWTNYWAGWMVKIINTNPCPIVINSFEARFQGTSGYRIYTKTGTFIGFEQLLLLGH